jgi:serine/threonine protein kinase
VDFVPSSRQGPFAVGDVLASAYRIERVLGIGGMGAVYEAEDLLLRRRVAVKVPTCGAHAPALRSEGEALAALHHPAFPVVHQLGLHGATEFLVMERLYGETLEARIDAGVASSVPLPMDEVFRILIAIAEGLAAAHRVGVVHRDLKPSNVILAGARVVLVDLGLFVPEVLAVPDAEPAGSVHSIAPEVLLRSVKNGEAALVDLYALGCIAFQLLSGRPPYCNESFSKTMMAHISAPVPDPRDLRSETPADLAALVREMLAKEPHDRPPCAEAVLWQLRAMEARAPHGTFSVLVVDDDVEVASSIRRALESSYPMLDVRATCDATRALPHGGRPPADVVVVDVQMPGTNGLEVCASLRTLPAAKRPAMIVMSGSAGPSDVDVLRSLGIDAFVPKDHALLRAVGDAIGRARASK